MYVSYVSSSNLARYCDQLHIVPKSITLQFHSASVHHHFKATNVCKMKRSKSIWWLILSTSLFLQMMGWVSASSRSSFITVYQQHCSPRPALHPVYKFAGSGLSPQAATYSLAQDAGDYKYEAIKIGSSPPSCDGKCYGCSPCEPIQVPTITSRVGLQYANYEPEGWQCKCGPLFYSP